MKAEESEIRRKRRVLERAVESGNVAKKRLLDQIDQLRIGWLGLLK
jgi:hypothetical protein